MALAQNAFAMVGSRLPNSERGLGGTNLNPPRAHHGHRRRDSGIYFRAHSRGGYLLSDSSALLH